MITVVVVAAVISLSSMKSPWFSSVHSKVATKLFSSGDDVSCSRRGISKKQGKIQKENNELSFHSSFAHNTGQAAWSSMWAEDVLLVKRAKNSESVCTLQ